MWWDVDSSWKEAAWENQEKIIKKLKHHWSDQNRVNLRRPFEHWFGTEFHLYLKGGILCLPT